LLIHHILYNIVIPKSINHQITQHFFFFTKRKPVLKEKQIIFSFLAQVLSLEKKESVVLIVWNLVVHYLQFITGMAIIFIS